MATINPPPYDLSPRPGDWVTSETLYAPMTEHVVVFEVAGAGEKWWAWCVVDLGGLGFSRIGWSRPMAKGPVTDMVGPDLAVRRTMSTPTVLFDFDTPLITGDAEAG